MYVRIYNQVDYGCCFHRSYYSKKIRFGKTIGREISAKNAFSSPWKTIAGFGNNISMRQENVIR